MFAPPFLPVFLDGRFGYIDRRGELVIRPQFSFAGMFEEGRAVVGQDCCFGYIDRDGHVVVDCTYDEAGPYCNGVAAVCQGGLFCLVDGTGTPLFPPLYETLTCPACGLALASLDDKFGFVGPSGEVRLPLVFDDASPLDVAGWAHVVLGEEAYFIDTEGGCVLRPDVPAVEPFYEGLAAACDGSRWGYLDRAGRWSIPPQYDGAKPCGDGLLAVSGEGVWGFVDRRGQPAIPFRFDNVTPFEGGLAWACTSEAWSVIDVSGRNVLPYSFPDAGRLVLGNILQVEWEPGNWGYVSLDGHAIWRA